MESNIWSESLSIPLILEEKLVGRSKFSLNSSALNYLPSGSPLLHIISIAGSQSSGKSTLMNHAFSLNFPKMAPSNNGQTTRGIDLKLTKLYVCLDMEGSGSAERDAEYHSYIERMIGAFGIVVSNLLIYNINILNIRSRHEVDYLAKMMTHYLRICKEKRRILFCIRDVEEGLDDLEDLRDKISQTFKEAWNKAKVESNNHKSTDDLESVFEMDLITCSKYKRKKGKFVDEDEVMTRLRDKVKEKLQDLNKFEVRSLKTLWSETWSNIDRNETIEFRQLVAWEAMRQRLNRKCNSLKSKMRHSGDYMDKLNKYYTEFSNEILVNYAHDEYAKQALLVLYRQEFAKQAVYLDVEHFKISIEKYFYSESELTPSLYKDLISIYQKIDIDDSDRNRIMKSVYENFLHKSAEEKNQYINTIEQSLNSIYSKTRKRINRNLAYLHEADITKMNFKIDFSDRDTVFLAVFGGIGGVLASFGLGLIAAEAAAATVVTAATVARMSATMIAGSVLVGVGVIGAATTVGMMAAWKRGTVWIDMAKKVRESIIDNELFQINYQKLINMFRISDFLSS